MRFYHRCFASIGLVSLFIGLNIDVCAQKSDSSIVSDLGFIGKMTHLAETTLSYLTYEKGRHSLAVFPAVGYTPRTGIEYGIMPVWRIKPREAGQSSFYRPTTITPALLFSTTGMFEVDADIDWHPASSWVVTMKNQYLFLPDKFYGVGNRHASTNPLEFDAYRYQLTGQIMKGWHESWLAGLEFNGGYARHHFSDGVEIPSAITGNNGGWANALGPVVAYDSRNNTSFPSKGIFTRLSCVGASGITGSQYQYYLATFDGRMYQTPFSDAGIIATQFYCSMSGGDVPFYQLPELGGKRALRGIPHPYKYIDRYVWYTQAEYRRMIWWRLGGVVYGGMGAAFHQLSHSISDTRFTGGVGLRVQALPGENLNFRIDYGLASAGDNALYFTIREAF